nr:hypothetical protein [Tanacetum cinerariifolium]
MENANPPSPPESPTLPLSESRYELLINELGSKEIIDELDDEIVEELEDKVEEEIDEEEKVEELSVEFFDKFPTSDELAYHKPKQRKQRSNQAYPVDNKIHATDFPELYLGETYNKFNTRIITTFDKIAYFGIEHWPSFQAKTHDGYDFLNQIEVLQEDKNKYIFSEVNFKSVNLNDVEDLFLHIMMKRDEPQSLLHRRLVVSLKKKEPYSMADKPILGTIYLKNNTKKRFMDHSEAQKFYNYMLEQVKEKMRSILLNHKYKYANPILTDDQVMRYEQIIKEIKRRLKFRRQMMRIE